MRDSSRFLATILFTDVVGSTERAAELGDRDWHALLATHHAAVRRALRRFGGREEGTAGDGFVATFAGPAQGIACAASARDAVRELGLEIRSGLHMGEVERTGATVGGIAVHICARVAALAAPGEVLVTSTIRDSLSGSGFGYDDRGVHALKGVPDPWRLYAVTKLPPGAGAGGQQEVLRRRIVTAARVLAVVGALALAARLFVGRGEPEPTRARDREQLSAAAAGERPARNGEAAATPDDGGSAQPAGTPTRGPLTLAVLPFRPLTSGADVGFLGLGIPDAIITKLSNLEGIRVRPTSSIVRYEKRDVDVAHAGRELGTDYLLTGNLQEAPDRLRVSVQLVRSSDGSSLWATEYDLRRADLLGLQDSIAQRVVAALPVELTQAERERLHRRYTDNVEAYQLYLQGRADLARYTAGGTRAAIGAFEAALRLDPGYALAHAGLAMASARIRFAPEDEFEEWERRAREEAFRALELDPRLAQAHEALAAVSRDAEFEWEQTIEESRRALALDPNLEGPHYYEAAAFYHLGLTRLADREVKLGRQINPSSLAEPTRLAGTAQLLAGDFAAAESLLSEAERLSSSGSTRWYLAQASYYRGEKRRAEQLLERLIRSGKTGQPERRAQATLASFLAARGEGERARRLLDEVIRGSYMDHHVAYAIGAANAQLGDTGEAVRWLRQAAETGLPTYPWYARDPLLTPIGGEAAFRDLLAELRDLWKEAAERYGEPPVS